MTDRETIETLAEKVMGIAHDRAAQLVLWNPLINASNTLECLGKTSYWSCDNMRDAPDYTVYIYDGHGNVLAHAKHPYFTIAACRAMIASVGGRAK